MPDVCAIGKVDDGTLRVCCSTHQHVLCAHHYARTHFVETSGDYHAPPCTERCIGNPPESGSTLQRYDGADDAR